MKALKYILYSLVIAAILGLMAYQYFVERNLETGNIFKGALIIAGAILGMVKPRKNRISNKKAVYQNAYAEHIQGAFADDPKLERTFYNAVHDYNNSKPAAGFAKLEKLRKNCQRTADLRAVTVFMALCCDDMRQYNLAIEYYESALSMRANSSLYSNLGLCYQQMGNMDAAEKNYRNAISVDPTNAYAYNNLSAMFFRQGEYEISLEYARKAIEHNNNLPQALGTAALCCGLLNDRENYEKYYRRAVTNGYDGRKIQITLQRLTQAVD